MLGKLRVVRELGVGGMGVVYEVYELDTGQRRAMKVLRKERSEDASAVSRLLREASIASKLRSPRLAETLEVGQLEDGSTFLLMEMLDGRTLAQRLDRDERLPVQEVLRLGHEMVEGLQVAHAAGVVHRDLTPRNVFLVRSDGQEHVKIVDFGLSKMVAGQTDRFGHLTDTGAFVGTPFYVSPEQASGKRVDTRADQYALGVILYECLTGERPFAGDSLLEVIGRIASGEYPPLRRVAPQLDPRLAATIEKAMSLRPEDRFEDIAAFARHFALEPGRTAPLDALGYSDTMPVQVARDDLAHQETAPLPPESRAPKRKASTPVRASPREKKRGTAWVIPAAMLLGVLVLGAAFAVTASILQLRTGGQTTEPIGVRSGGAATQEQRMRRLGELASNQDYRGCLQAAQHMPRNVSVLEIALECAERGSYRDISITTCDELTALDRDNPRAVRCRRLIRQFRALQRQ